MSYWESLTEHDEILAWEEGRLQGMQDLRRLIYHTKLTDPIVPKHVRRLYRAIQKAIREQQTLVDEMRGEKE